MCSFGIVSSLARLQISLHRVHKPGHFLREGLASLAIFSWLPPGPPSRFIPLYEKLAILVIAGGFCEHTFCLDHTLFFVA